MICPMCELVGWLLSKLGGKRGVYVPFVDKKINVHVLVHIEDGLAKMDVVTILELSTG